MSSKAFMFLGLLVISSQVQARELAEDTTTTSKEVEMKNVVVIDDYKRGGGNGGGYLGRGYIPMEARCCINGCCGLILDRKDCTCITNEKKLCSRCPLVGEKHQPQN